MEDRPQRGQLKACSTVKGSLQTQTASFAIIKLLLLFNTTAITNHINSTRSAPLSMNELTTVYWNSYTIWNLFMNIS